MAQNDRLFGFDVHQLKLGTTGSEVDYSASLISATVSSSMDTQEATALKDGVKYPQAIRYGWTLEAELVIDTTASAMALIPNFYLTRTSVSVIAALANPANFGSGSSLPRYTGKAIITGFTGGSPDGPQTLRITLTGQGALTYTAVAGTGS